MLDVAVATAPDTTDGAIWITAAYRDLKNSKHATGEAFDIRIKNVVGFNTQTFAYSKVVAAWAERMRKELGPGYDVVYAVPGHYNHIHVESDPHESLIILSARNKLY